MFTSIIKSSFRKIFIELSDKYNIDKNNILKVYLDEHSNNTELTIYKYQSYELLKDCFNNLYLPNEDNNIELIGYINTDNDIVFDKLMIKQKNIQPIKKPRKPRKKKVKDQNYEI